MVGGNGVDPAPTEISGANNNAGANP